MAKAASANLVLRLEPPLALKYFSLPPVRPPAGPVLLGVAFTSASGRPAGFGSGGRVQAFLPVLLAHESSQICFTAHLQWPATTLVAASDSVLVQDWAMSFLWEM